ncbi:hypothetical protein [Staphylococcus arlettae]|nr:hypothetical protein [Staphylococcus arlettae]EJY95757.1 hypothetical protein SARL_05922 [Staphylococcus arlettae CVD059]
MIELKYAMKQSRNKVKEIVREKTNGFEDQIFWEESLKSWIVIDNDMAREILTSANFTANRKKKFINKLNVSNERRMILE